MTIVYLRPEDADAPPPPFRTGDAGHGWIDRDGVPQTDVRVRLSANSVHAMLGHGVVDELNRLPLEFGCLGAGRDVLLPAPALDDGQVLVGVDGPAGGEPLAQGVELRLVLDPPDEPAQSRARLEGGRQRGVAGRPELDLAAVQSLEAGAAVALAGRGKSPIGEEP